MADALTCPGCRASIPEERHLDGALPIGEEPVERSCFACPGCLGIVAIELLVRPQRNYWDPPEPPADPKTVMLVSGGAVARILERVRADGAAGMSDLGADPFLRLALRVPEVFAVARPLLGTKAVMACAAWFDVVRESRTVSSGPGSVGVEGYWSPGSSEPELVPGHPLAEARFLERPQTKEEPWILQPLPLLQLDAGQAMLVRGAPLDVVGEERALLKVRPLDSEWVRTGAINFFRATLDLLAPDPDRI